MSTASKVAEDKLNHPHKFCPAQKCLWKTGDGSYCPKHKPTCRCNASTGICGCTTYGTGKLDYNGYWEVPCPHGKEVHTC
ncbi:MAG: hypothetical protein ABSE80_13895 [Halobacteriota archaeon]